MKPVAVLGTGQMGSTLARLLLAAHVDVRVWNRTPGRAEALHGLGATVAAAPGMAIAPAHLVVMCVHDHAAVRAILGSADIDGALGGKVLLQFTTSSPQEARAQAEQAHGFGAGYVSGAIQVAPEQMGKADTTILVSGATADLERALPVLEVFGGNIVRLGDNPAAAASMDLATLSYVYGAAAGFFQGAALAERAGLDVRAYGEIVETMAPSFGQFLRHEGNAIAANDFSITQSPLSISVDATRRIEDAMRTHGLNMALPGVTATLLRQAAQAGHEREELAAVIKVLRTEQYLQ